MASSSFFDPSGAFGAAQKGGFGGESFATASKLGGLSKDNKFSFDKGIDFLSSFLEKRGQDKYRSKAEEDYDYPRTLGQIDTRGFGGSQMFDNFSIYTAPPSHSPFYIPGSKGGGGFSGGGAASGALSGALAGAKLGSIIPGIGNIGGAIAGGIIGGVGGGFG